MSYGGPVEGEPALELGLEGELPAELRLQVELTRGVALLGARLDEGVEVAALDLVDEADVLVARGEGEDGAEDLLAEAVLRERLRDDVDLGHGVLDLGVADHRPLVAVL